ncbi:MAG: cytochrome P450 [Pseudomonadota bacterium]
MKASSIEPTVSHAVLDPRLPGDSLALLQDVWREHGDYVQLELQGSDNPAYLLSDPVLIEQTLAQHHDSITRGFAGDRLALMLGQGLLVNDGELWKTQRQLMHPLFHRGSLGWLGATAERSNSALVERLQSSADRGAVLDLNRVMLDFSLGFNLDILFGPDAARLKALVEDDFFEKLTEEPAGTTRENLLFLRDTERLRRHLTELIAERHRRSATDQPDLLDGLIGARDRRSGAPMAAAQIVDELLSLLTAGHVTIASGLSSLWRSLMQQPLTMSRLRAEAATVCGGAPARAAAYTELSFTRRCVQEALRLTPPIWIMTRRTTAPIRLGACEVPAETQLVIAPALVHHHPAHWTDAEAFLPERFTPEATRARNRYAYLPFSAGPRSCLGDQLSLLQNTLHVATVIQTFDLTADGDGFVSEPGFVYRSKAPFSIRLTRHEPS